MYSISIDLRKMVCVRKSPKNHRERLFFTWLGFRMPERCRAHRSLQSTHAATHESTHESIDTKNSETDRQITALVPECAKGRNEGVGLSRPRGQLVQRMSTPDVRSIRRLLHSASSNPRFHQSNGHRSFIVFHRCGQVFVCHRIRGVRHRPRS